MSTRLDVEVWMRKSKKGYQYRGMVRRGTDYLYTGEWLSRQLDAAREANKAAERITKRDSRSVKH